MPQLAEAHQGLIAARTYHYAQLWKITRTDGVVKRFTNHNVNVPFGGESYLAAPGVIPSAAQRQDGLRGTNAEYQGAITSTDLTDDDFYAGRYAKASILESVVDWRFPYMGALTTNQWYVLDVEHDSIGWRVQLGSLAHRMNRVRGMRATRTCNHVLGDGRSGGSGFCSIDIDTEGTYKWTGVDVDSVVDRKSFTLDSTPLGTPFSSSLTPDHFFDFGYVEFTSGANAGLKFDIQDSMVKTGNSKKQEIVLFEQLPFDVALGDLATIYVGCDRLFETCKTKFSNGNQFGGFHLMPGFKEMLFATERA